MFELMFSNNETVTDSITGLVTAIFGEHDPVTLVRHYQICICVYICMYVFASDWHLFQVINAVK